MAVTDDIRKVLTDPKPFYALAGTADLAAEKAREVPGAVEKIIDEAPKRFEAVRSTDPKAVQEQITKQAKEAQEWLTGLLGTLDADFKKLSQQAQDLALQGVGRVAEAAAKVQDKYGELADRGEKAVQTWRGEAAEEVQDLAVAIEPEPKQDPAKAESETGAGTAAKDNGDEAKAAPAKKTTAKKTTAKKTTPSAK